VKTKKNQNNDDLNKLHFVNKKKSTTAKLAIDKKITKNKREKILLFKNLKYKVTMIG